MKHLVVISALTLGLCVRTAWADVLADAAAAAEEVVAEKVASAETDESGVAVTNWTDGYIEVTAVGTANVALAQNKAHALSQAEETARALAYRKLTERIYGVHINSRVTVHGAVAADDSLVAVTQGLIRDAHEVKVTHEELEDGSILCAVTLAVPMTTARGLAAVAARVPPGDGLPADTTAAGTPVTGYTGVVIDATDVGAAPALCPTLLTEDGRVVYGAGTLSPERISTFGVASYAKTLAQAQAKGAGGKPLILKAIKAAGEYACDLVLPRELVDILFSLDNKDEILNGGRLVILTRGVE